MLSIPLHLHALTIGSSSIETKLEATARYYDGISIPAVQIEQYLNENGGDLNVLKEALAKHNVKLVEMGVGPALWQCLPHDKKDEQFSKIDEYFAWAKELGVPHFVACGLAGDGDFNEAVEDFQRLCRLAANHGIKVAFEWMGFSPLIGNLDRALELLDKAGEPNAGLNLDVFHFYRGQSSLDTLRSLDPSIFLAVHINDAEAGDRETLNDGDRVMPGDGVAPVDEIVSYLAENNWNGPIALELGVESDFWKLDPMKVAEEGAQKTRAFLDKYFK